VVPEAPLRKTDAGLVPEGEGWFVVNAREALWKTGDYGAYTRFDGDARFPQIGINIGVLQPGQPACMYHGEEDQEGFLVLSGECLLLVEGEERRLRAWDFFHCPPWTEHVFVGAGVEEETNDGAVAYAPNAEDVDTPYRDGWLPSSA